ncbi:MAG TPA: glycoside hydrolase family 38 C-terminal domain-containing protein, partial [Myxococcota bacterium]|nr:glycoside hydrolase family 38 C-terminal domain-containing protein [Myxococcota bacterium]
KELPRPFFWWQGQDGSRVLAIRPPAGHYAAWQDDLGDLIREAAEKARELGMEHTLVCYGVGNHGGGPTKKSIASIRALQRDPGQPHALFSTIDAFRAAVATQAESFPTVIGDLQHHAPGCYTTHSEIKRLNRLAESRLTAAERWCALAFLATGREPETAEFGHAWRQVLFNQFHDTLAGTSLPVAYADARERFGEAFAIAARLENAALQSLAALIDTRIDADSEPPAAAKGHPILLFNPSPWERTDGVSVQWGWLASPGDRLIDDRGGEIPFQAAQPDVFPAGFRIQFEATLPAHGYRVYRLVKGETKPTELVTWDVPSPGPRPVSLENRFYSLSFDPQRGDLVRLLDKVHGVEVLRAPCSLLVLEDPGDTWGHDIPSWRNEIGRFASATVHPPEGGLAQITLRIDSKWKSSTTRQEFTLHRDNPRIDVVVQMDWHEKHEMVKLSVPTGVTRGTLTFDAPYSTIVREAGGLEEPGQAWIDLSGFATTTAGRELPYGISLLNDGKFGFDCLGSDLRMSLLRSPIYCFHNPARTEPDGEYLYTDQGLQTIRYALLPHGAGWREAGTVREAHALNNPFVGVFQYPHRGEWGASRSLMSVDPPSVTACVLKGAEDGTALVLRLFETHGRPCEATIALVGKPPMKTRMGAWELKTLRLEGDGGVREVDLLE